MSRWRLHLRNMRFSCEDTFAQTCLRIGNATDYMQIDSEGRVSYAGRATEWDDSMVPAANMRTGVSSLTFDNLTANLMAYRFDINDIAYMAVQMPHSLKVGSEIKPHLHLVNKNSIGATGYNVAFNWRYIWANIGSAFGAEQVESNVKCSFQNAAALTHKILALPDITPSASQGGISSILVCSLERVAADAEPYNTNDVFTLGFDIHFERDSGGSREPTEK